jgi:hypothetical protein
MDIKKLNEIVDGIYCNTGDSEIRVYAKEKGSNVSKEVVGVRMNEDYDSNSKKIRWLDIIYTNEE